MLITNFHIYESIARDSHKESMRFMEEHRRPKPDDSPGYIKTLDPEQKSFKASLITIVFAGIYLEAFLYIQGRSKLGAKYKHRVSFEKKLRLLGIEDSTLLEKCREFSEIRNRLVHENAGSKDDLNTIYVGQDEASKAIAFLDAAIPAIRRAQ